MTTAVDAPAVERDAKPNGAEPAFELVNVTFDYAGEITAARDISMSIASGEKVAILGANGSGKSTILRILNGLAFPSAGSVRAFGRDINERVMNDEASTMKFRRRMGFLFQNPEAQLFSATIREEIAFGPLNIGLERAEIELRIDDLAGALGMTGLLDRPPFRLSGGEKKKVALASILAMSPDALLLDEPTSGLDPRTQQWIVELLIKLNRAGKTIITATHDLTHVPLLADRVVVLTEDHQIAADGPAREILADTALLSSVNLIHEHAHWHGNLYHSHPHFHGGEHEHEHEH